MKKLILRGIAAVIAVTAAWAPVKAQEPGQIPSLPLDPEIRTGVLDNGMTYYVRHNDTPKGQADFYIAQKVGSILEEDHQRGLAHFLEHMCFNGTQNFPGKGIINWLETKGVKFGQNLNAYTGVDETVYNISNVPCASKAVQDSCLLILHDWSCALTLDPAEIDAERGVIHEEWRQSMAGQMRVIEQLLPTMYPDSRYGYRLPIGTMEVVDNFPPQAIIDYYHTWYRPDQQGIIVVGDIDPEYIEGKIKEMFSPIPMPENAREREYFEVEETPGTIFALGADKEIKSAGIEMLFKTNAMKLPKEYRNTAAHFMTEYMRRMITSMLNNRLADLASKPETEYARARVSIGDYFLAKTTGALDLDVVAKDTDVVPAFQQAYRELLRAARGGFTVGEYERARAELLSGVEKEYNERDHRQNETFSRGLVRTFVDGVPFTDMATYKAMYDQMANMLPLEQLNTVLPQMITEDNRVVLALIPEAEGYTLPTEEGLTAAIEAVEAEELEPYKDEMRTDPLIPSLPAPGTIASTSHNAEWDATEYVLSNGVKVLVKRTSFKPGEIFFGAIAQGNALADIDPAKASSVKFLPVAMMNEAYYDYSNSDLKKYIQGKQIEIGLSADGYTRSLQGQTVAKDLPTAMELIYSLFTGFNLKEDEFEARRSAIAGIIANQETDPQFVFQKSFLSVLFGSPMRQAMSLEDVKAANREDIIAMVHNMTANAADYLFVFTGDIDDASFIPLMEQYIATLPADAAKATRNYTVNKGFEFVTGTETNTFTTPMQTPQTWVLIILNGDMPYNAENKALTEAAAQVLSKRLLNKIREEMGAVYSIGAAGMMTRTGENNTIFQIGFPMKPEMKDEALAEIKNIIWSMPTTVTAEEVAPAVEFMQKDIKEKLEKNEEWAESMTATSINGVQTFLNTADVLPGITAEKVQKFMQDIINQGNYRVIVVDPETK